MNRLEDNECVNSKDKICDFNVEDENFDPEFGAATEQELI